VSLQTNGLGVRQALQDDVEHVPSRMRSFVGILQYNVGDAQPCGVAFKKTWRREYQSNVNCECQIGDPHRPQRRSIALLY
jgi:hypothetical protein